MGKAAPKTALQKRIYPKVVYKRQTPNCSARTMGIGLIVLHSTESSQVMQSESDLRGITDFLCRSSVQASAHVVVDGDGHSARICRDRLKAWHVGNLNSPALGIEQIGRAAQGVRAWLSLEKELHETARWIALMSIVHRVPIQTARLTSGGSIIAKGVTTHRYCSEHGAGTDHWDPGDYPMGKVLWLARGYKREQGRARKH